MSEGLNIFNASRWQIVWDTHEMKNIYESIRESSGRFNYLT